MSANYYPSDTTKIVKFEFISNLEPVYGQRHRDRVLSDLNRGGIVSNLLHNQISGLSRNARIWVESRNNRWLITDGTQNFIIRKERGTLKVYKRPAIDNCALEYRYFLEIDLSGKGKIDFPRYTQPPNPDLIRHLRDRQVQQLRQIASQGFCVYCVDATVDWRLIVGLGSEHVQETNMTLHHIYGIPYIPGSAVKGVLRHWWLEDFNNDEDKALKDKNFLTLFGSQEQRGEVQFLDAYPEEVHFATDIMNPHYPEYYGGSKPPTDHQNPVPINFLTVQDTTFRFVFLAKTQLPLDELKKRFRDALELKGIGAKTASGYGYFRDFTEQTNAIIGQLKSQP